MSWAGSGCTTISSRRQFVTSGTIRADDQAGTVLPEMPLVSVIVPVYNIERYVNDCVGSIVAQTYENLEVMLIDDGSTDSSGKLCDEWAHNDARVHVIHQANAGLSAARNSGIEAATGQVILFVDGDDTVEAALAVHVVEQMRASNTAIVSYENSLIDEHGAFVGLPQRRSMARHSQTIAADKALLLMFQGRLPHFAWKYAVNADLFTDTKTGAIRYPVGRKLEDVATTYRLLAAANSVRRTPDILYHYRQREGSILHSSGILWDDWLAVFREIRDQLGAREPKWCAIVDRWALTVGIDLVFGLRNSSKAQVAEYSHVAAWVRDRLCLGAFVHLPWRQKFKVFATSRVLCGTGENRMR